MTLKELCQARFSCRGFTDEPIEAGQLDYIKECVRLAPSAKNLQPWRFLLVTDEATLAKVCDCCSWAWVRTAPAIVVCLQDREGAWTRELDGKNHADIDIAIATEHLCLAATEVGLGTCWICSFDVPRLCQTVDLPQGYVPAALIPIGHPAQEPHPKVRKPVDEVWA